MNAAECTRLGAYLSKLLGSPTVSVVSKSAEEADVLVDGKRVAGLLRDEDEGELSYSIGLTVPPIRMVGIDQRWPKAAHGRSTTSATTGR